MNRSAAIAAWASVALAGWFAFCMALVPVRPRPPPVRMIEAAWPAAGPKSDRLPIVEVTQPVEEPTEVVPAVEPPPEAAPVVEEKPAPPPKPNDICARHGGRRQTYYKAKREMWRCVYD